jgi:hypothetical protein
MSNNDFFLQIPTAPTVFTKELPPILTGEITKTREKVMCQNPDVTHITNYGFKLRGISLNAFLWTFNIRSETVDVFELIPKVNTLMDKYRKIYTMTIALSKSEISDLHLQHVTAKKDNEVNQFETLYHCTDFKEINIDKLKKLNDLLPLQCFSPLKNTLKELYDTLIKIKDQAKHFEVMYYDSSNNLIEEAIDVINIVIRTYPRAKLVSSGTSKFTIDFTSYYQE